MISRNNHDRPLVKITVDFIKSKLAWYDSEKGVGRQYYKEEQADILKLRAFHHSLGTDLSRYLIDSELFELYNIITKLVTIEKSKSDDTFNMIKDEFGRAKLKALMEIEKNRPLTIDEFLAVLYHAEHDQMAKALIHIRKSPGLDLLECLPFLLISSNPEKMIFKLEASYPIFTLLESAGVVITHKEKLIIVNHPDLFSLEKALGIVKLTIRVFESIAGHKNPISLAEAIKILQTDHALDVGANWDKVVDSENPTETIARIKTITNIKSLLTITNIATTPNLDQVNATKNVDELYEALSAVGLKHLNQPIFNAIAHHPNPISMQIAVDLLIKNPKYRNTDIQKQFKNVSHPDLVIKNKIARDSIKEALPPHSPASFSSLDLIDQYEDVLLLKEGTDILLSFKVLNHHTLCSIACSEIPQHAATAIALIEVAKTYIPSLNVGVSINSALNDEQPDLSALRKLKSSLSVSDRNSIILKEIIKTVAPYIQAERVEMLNNIIENASSYKITEKAGSPTLFKPTPKSNAPKHALISRRSPSNARGHQ